MKTVSFVIALLCIGQILFAQQITDPKGHIIIDAKGKIYMQGTKIGSISKDSIVKNAKGQKIAFLRGDGMLEDANGKPLGRMGKDGRTYYNPNGQVVLQVKDNTNTKTCDVLDANGKVIGNVHSTYKSIACAVHCFSNKMDPKTHQKLK